MGRSEDNSNKTKNASIRIGRASYKKRTRCVAGEKNRDEDEEIDPVTTSLKINPKLWEKANLGALKREIKLYALMENTLKKEIEESDRDN
jgi:hypothetical protein